MLDVFIRGGDVVDPVNKTRKRANVGVKDGKIAFVSERELDARRVIDAAGCIVCPGFIDPHGHLEGDAYTGELSLRQGVTTTIGGNCGFSPANIGAFFDRQEREGYVIHQAEMIGHSATLRALVGLRDVHTPACPVQIGAMLKLCELAFDQGACGLSLGLAYAPGTSMEEVLPLCELAAARGRVVSIDTRMYTQTDLYSLVEAITLARKTGVRLQISHFVYQYGVGVEDEALALIDCARRSGVDVYLDSGMYTDWATHMGAAIFDRDLMEDNGISLSHIRVATGEHRGELLTPRLYEHMRACHPDDSAVVFTGEEDAVYTILRHPLAMPSSDAGAYAPGEGHPQIAGSFPRFFNRMVTKRGDLSWEEAIYRATALPAQVFGLTGKGSMAEGADADIAIFDPERFCDRADFVGLGLPDAPPEGMRQVIVGGKVELDQGEVKQRSAGHVIRF